MFADKYLQKNGHQILINKLPEQKPGLIVVIPCFREPDLVATLESLNKCDLPEVAVEVIVLINHSEKAEEATIRENEQTKTDADAWIAKNKKEGIHFFVVGPVQLKRKWAGAGLARKRGMDEAIRRFNLNDSKDGILVSLDADTLVAKNYLVAIEKHFRDFPKHVGATVAFEHQKQQLSGKHLEGIELYELYLNYYKRALHYSGYPYSMFTIGSAFAVTAEAYVKRGGMNRRQAGEDFYFLQNLVQLGTVGEITTTKVHPSARLSNRVPFGTGPILQKWMKGEEDLQLTYNFKAFKDLEQFFAKKDQLFKTQPNEYSEFVNTLNEPIKQFLLLDNFSVDLDDLNNNCSRLESFRLRFFQKFNAFRILKFLNFAHENYYQKADLRKQVELLDQEQ
ncbi:glycosyltransferase [Draconibacterium sp. IB214405]|uniref:glycosyltransferase n=1 Tax=Draconibacterium sp. IB214405 TaxID=3097352 RepID=UPI002A0D4EB7|nr:glycosyltransferase [Draconibacterium sp. IB214405]MDX8340498.1 glycosyltransferase [Draconibacterium sp. IB214405]